MKRTWFTFPWKVSSNIYISKFLYSKLLLHTLFSSFNKVWQTENIKKAFRICATDRPWQMTACPESAVWDFHAPTTSLSAPSSWHPAASPAGHFVWPVFRFIICSDLSGRVSQGGKVYCISTLSAVRWLVSWDRWTCIHVAPGPQVWRPVSAWIIITSPCLEIPLVSLLWSPGVETTVCMDHHHWSLHHLHPSLALAGWWVEWQHCCGAVVLWCCWYPDHCCCLPV